LNAPAIGKRPTTRLLTIEEYGSLLLPLSERDYSRVLGLYRGKLDVAPAGTPGLYRLSARDYVGRVRLSRELMLEVRPRIPVSNLFHMLAGAAGLAWFHPPRVTFGTSEGAPGILAAALVSECEALLEGGLLQAFTAHEGDLPMVRGRILLDKQVARYGELKHRHVCAYSTRTLDTPENRVLVSTLRYLPSLLSEHEGDLAARVRALTRAFEGVRPLAPREAAEAVRTLKPDRRNRRYLPALSLCALILNHLSVAATEGSRPFASFLVDMPRLFETYLTIRLRTLLPAHGLRVFAQRHDYLDEAGRVRIRPDILIYPKRGNTPLLVVDAKYRSTGSDRSSDLYQLSAYMERYGLPAGALVYPQPDPQAPTELRLRGTGRRLHLLSLGLGLSTPSLLEAACVGLAGTLARLTR
jgi:5-methylcytosine-specific restriction enzyme subunit McrC